MLARERVLQAITKKTQTVSRGRRHGVRLARHPANSSAGQTRLQASTSRPRNLNNRRQTLVSHDFAIRQTSTELKIGIRSLHGTRNHVAISVFGILFHWDDSGVSSVDAASGSPGRQWSCHDRAPKFTHSLHDIPANFQQTWNAPVQIYWANHV